MTFIQLFHSAAAVISKGVPTTKGFRRALAVCLAGLLAVVTPLPVLADATPLDVDLSLKIGPLATELKVTKPSAQSVTTPSGGSAVVFRSTLHVHAQNDTQTPTFNADLVATGEAADPDTLVGGFLPAAIRVEQDLAAGMTFQDAAADAQAKTGVTVTFLEDPTAVEYAIQLALIIVVCITAITTSNLAPPLNGDACAIQSKLVAGLTSIGIATPPLAAACTTIP